MVFRAVLIDFARLLFLFFSFGFYVGSGFGVGGKCLWLMAFLYEGLVFFIFFLCAREVVSRGPSLFHSVCVFCIIALYFLFCCLSAMFLSSVQGSLLWEHNTVNFAQVLVILDGIGLYTWIYLGTLLLGSIHLNKVLVCPTLSSTVAELYCSGPHQLVTLDSSPLFFLLILTPYSIRVPFSPQSMQEDS